MNSLENIIKKFHPHPFYFLIFYFSGIAFVVVSFYFSPLLLIVGFLTFILGEVARRAETFYILKSGVAREYKLLSTSSEFAGHDKIQNIEVRQNFLENLLGIGSIHIDTAGGDEKEINFYGIKDPYSIEKIIRAQMIVL